MPEKNISQFTIAIHINHFHNFQELTVLVQNEQPQAQGWDGPAPGGYDAPAPGGWDAPAPGGYDEPAQGGWDAPESNGWGK